MGDKQFKTLEEQIELFKYKGLVIRDAEYAKRVLLKENYFFLNGYRHIFMKSSGNKKYIDGTTFEELYSLFLFDRQFRNIMFKNLLILENNIKSIISYQLSKKYGYKESDYLKIRNFDSRPDKIKQINDLIKKMKRQIRINGSQHGATMHYINNYGYVPLWVLVKVLSFGIVSELYTVLKPEDRKAIADLYHVNTDTFSKYLVMLSNYRNLCAHEDILFENKSQRIIDDTPYHLMLNIDKTNGEYIYGKNDLFAVIIIMKQLLSNNEIKDMVIEIDHALDNLSYKSSFITI